MNAPTKHDVAISFSADDAWIAKDLSSLLKEVGLTTYFSENDPDFAGGFLRKELKGVYDNSTINVMLWSSSYSSKPKDSVVSLEKNLIWERHIGRSDHKTLFILNVDKTSISEDFEMCLTHEIKSTGLLKSRDYIINRTIECFKATFPNEGRYIHPKGKEFERGGVIPCQFRLSSNFRQDKLGRWNAVADIMVVPFNMGIPKDLKTYMIPSGSVPSFLSHSTMLKTNTDCLACKSKLGLSFVKAFSKKDLQGVIFYIRRGQMEYPHIYCYEYDKYLCENFNNVLIQDN